ncbi:hypothetical protein R3P38DRAFT_3296534 [Favolaschia claudopus]|uniref:Uncharacterized protein n=1 Tax=Favolaschia claudopus TaxID=2862362 RepID=A0AAV9Z8K0_9AGAR
MSSGLTQVVDKRVQQPLRKKVQVRVDVIVDAAERRSLKCLLLSTSTILSPLLAASLHGLVLLRRSAPPTSFHLPPPR